MITAIVLPNRMPNSNLRSYSKVLNPDSELEKRQIPKCISFKWEQPVYLNVTPNEATIRNMRSEGSDEWEIQAKSLRKLESQKGEVRSLWLAVFI